MIYLKKSLNFSPSREYCQAAKYYKHSLHLLVQVQKVLIKMAEIFGTIENDLLFGTSENDIIDTLEGNDDVVSALEGNNAVLGGFGDENIFGAAGNDELYY